jgi:hypothetical protein
VNSPRRLLAGIAAVLTVSLVATGCDSSPFAASINGQVIKQTALNAEIRALAGNPSYVKLAETGGYVAKDAVTIAGVTSGTYSAKWTSGVLDSIVIGAVVHQHLERTHHLPGPGQLAATRAVDALLYGPAAWDRFSPSFRSTIVGRDADLAMVEPSVVSPTALQSFFGEYGPYLFSSVCVRTVTIDVDNTTGGVDYAASASKAAAVVAAIDAAPTAPAGGSVACYTAAQLETLSRPFVSRVLPIKTGTAAAPETTADGSQVTAITSRALIPSGAALGQAYTVAVNASQGRTAALVAGLLRAAHVKINPLYGTWDGGATVPGIVSTPAPALSTSS